jgi:hypothetical protein
VGRRLIYKSTNISCTVSPQINLSTSLHLYKSIPPPNVHARLPFPKPDRRPLEDCPLPSVRRTSPSRPPERELAAAESSPLPSASPRRDQALIFQGPESLPSSNPPRHRESPARNDPPPRLCDGTDRHAPLARGHTLTFDFTVIRTELLQNPTPTQWPRRYPAPCPLTIRGSTFQGLGNRRRRVTSDVNELHHSPA